MKKVLLFKHNPAANGVGLSASADNTCKLWDVQSQSEVANLELSNTPYWIDWNQTGTQALVTHKDKKFVIVDPRQPGAAASYDSFQGTKSARVIHCEEANLLFGCGFGRGSSRQYAIWDPRNAAKAIAQKDLDTSASVINPTWVGDNGVLFLVGKGDASVRYFELESEAPHLHFLSEFRDSKSQKGGGFKPKRTNDVGKCEIAHFMRLMPDLVMPVSFQVPRKSDLFQADIFPDAYAGVASMDSKSYFAGGTPAVPQRVSMKPGAAPTKSAASSGGSGFTVRKSAAELQEENEQLKKKIASLEAELAALKA
jgi:coronin-1B/1C/6